MSRIILDPPRDVRACWGLLAHVDREERGRIMDLQPPERRMAIANLRREVDRAMEDAAEERRRLKNQAINNRR